MESSPAKRLPEVHSLPDGFVDSSTEAPLPTNSFESPHDWTGVEALRGDEASESEDIISANAADLFSMKVAEGTSTQDYKELEVPQDSSLCFEGVLELCSSSAPANEGFSELHVCNLKESQTDECTKSLTNLSKQEFTEVKRKASKQSSKAEKELTELTLKYHKVIAERDAAVAVRDRLESLCRELQRQNKLLMEEGQRVLMEGQNMRSDLSKKFNDAIKDVNNKLEEQKHDCLSQLKENELLRNKLTHLADQYALSEQQFAQKLKQKTIELQLADLKLQQQKERSVEEQSQMQLYVEQVTQLLESEKSLRLQLAADGEKFQQFQDALMKSNEVFETLKQEMEKMAKLIKELKKDNEFLKSKCEKSDIALVKLVEEREYMKKQLEKAKNQKEKLESLCRSLQAERKQTSLGCNRFGSVDVQSKVDASKGTT